MELPKGEKIAGTRQTLRALAKREAKLVYLAKDAEAAIQERVLSAAKEAGASVQEVPTMYLLGRLFGLAVPTAVGAIISMNRATE